MGSSDSKYLANASGFVKAVGTTLIGGLSGGVGSRLAGGKFWDGFRNGAISPGLNHAAHSLQQSFENRGRRILFDGQKIRVLNRKGEVLWEGHATSGKGKYMNDPNAQHLQDLGPIPEGEYYFSGKDWNAQSPLRQLYNIVRGNGDWGDYNVRLKPVTYKGSRHSFYLHGGKYPGSAGCIDALGGIKQIRNLTFRQNRIDLQVKY